MVAFPPNHPTIKRLAGQRSRLSALPAWTHRWASFSRLDRFPVFKWDEQSREMIHASSKPAWWLPQGTTTVGDTSCSSYPTFWESSGGGEGVNRQWSATKPYN